MPTPRTDPASPTPTSADAPPPRRGVALAGPSVLPGPRLTAVLLVLFPLGEIVEEMLSPLAGTTTAADLAGITAHPTRFVLSVLIGLASTLVAIPAFFGLANACAGRTPRLARVSAWVMVACMCGFVGVRVTQALELQVTREGLAPGVAARLVDHVSGNAIFAPLAVLFLVGTVVGIALLAVTTWRAGFPRPAAGLLVGFEVFELVNFHGGPLGTVLSHTLLLAALAWMGQTLWSASRRDAQTPGSRARTASAEAGIQVGAPATSR